MTGERRLNPSQAIVFADGTMEYQFRDFILRVDAALVNASINAVWGQIGGSLANQGDLSSALADKSDVGHTHVEAEITDLDKYSQSAIDAFLALKADVNHTHTIADIVDLVLGQLLPAGGDAGQVPTKVDGTNYNIVWADQTGGSGGGTYVADGQGIEEAGNVFSLELDGTTLEKSAAGLKVADFIDGGMFA